MSFGAGMMGAGDSSQGGWAKSAGQLVGGAIGTGGGSAGTMAGMAGQMIGGELGTSEMGASVGTLFGGSKP